MYTLKPNWIELILLTDSTTKLLPNVKKSAPFNVSEISTQSP